MTAPRHLYVNNPRHLVMLKFRWGWEDDRQNNQPNQFSPVFLAVRPKVLGINALWPYRVTSWRLGSLHKNASLNFILFYLCPVFKNYFKCRKKRKTSMLWLLVSHVCLWLLPWLWPARPVRVNKKLWKCTTAQWSSATLGAQCILGDAVSKQSLRKTYICVYRIFKAHCRSFINLTYV